MPRPLPAPASLLSHLWARLREQLWWKPLLFCALSLLAVTAAELGDVELEVTWLPAIEDGTLRALLQVMSGSMLVVATFAVGSMVSAYASASTTATPRSFPLIVADDLSQNALSVFLGAFIYSVVALIAVHQRSFGQTGRFLLFVLTIGMFVLVVLMLIAWVDRIARLGRLGYVVARLEASTEKALVTYARAPHLGAAPLAETDEGDGRLVHADRPAYVQHFDLARLQEWAEGHDARLDVLALPGTFATAARPLLRVHGECTEADDEELRAAFTLGDSRTFEGDPRFGLTVLSEIASRALSPGVNDPGSAIEVTGVLLRLLTRWAEEPRDEPDQRFDRLRLPGLTAGDLCDDSFTGIARDGAGSVEVVLRLQRALEALAHAPDEDLRAAAQEHGRRALTRAEAALTCDFDLERVRGAADELEAAFARHGSDAG